jgi:hypothetical protein
MYRGSQKHVLDWTDTPEFVAELLKLVSPVDAQVSATSRWMPKGHNHPAEARLELFGPKWLPGHIAWRELQRWWLIYEARANTPNWDIALGCEIEGKPGLVLVEAKANVTELGRGGKSLDAAASERSRANHRRIEEAIGQACEALRAFEPLLSISADSHYQLSNRIAFAWKLANLGIPTAVVYLGFIGDSGIADVSAPFRDDAHWRDTFEQYAEPVVPLRFFERRLQCGSAPAWILVRSRPVLQLSEPRSSNQRRYSRSM